MGHVGADPVQGRERPGLDGEERADRLRPARARHRPPAARLLADLARRSDERQLDTRITGRLSEQPSEGEFLADELSLQLFKQAGLPPRSSRIETLSRYALVSPDQISGEQWQASYGSPEEGLAASARSHQHVTLTLERLQATEAG